MLELGSYIYLSSYLILDVLHHFLLLCALRARCAHRMPEAKNGSSPRGGAGRGVFAQATFFLALRAAADADLHSQYATLREMIEREGGRVMKHLDEGQVRTDANAPGYGQRPRAAQHVTNGAAPRGCPGQRGA